jgi:2'-5' RNA ligase
MGTRWRGMLAPIDTPTGDGRRMATGAFRSRELPVGLKWQREDNMGHDTSVVVGLVDDMAIGLSVADAVEAGWVSAELVAELGLQPDDVGVWGRGELFDDHPELPRLAEDVAEAVLLTGKRVIGPSVDAGAAEMMLVEEGTDEPLTDERFEQIVREAEATGVGPRVEMLFTDYEIAAATLVPIPAFAQARPFELMGAPATALTAATIGALTAAAPTYPADAFDNPNLDRIAPITVEDRGEGFQRVFGYAAQWGVCHTGIPGVCTTAPTSPSGYAYFHRYGRTADGVDLPVAAGRLTTGHGQFGTSCSCRGCRGKDDHACDLLSLAGAIGHYDRLKTLAYVRAGEDERGIWIAGILAPDVDDDDRAVLARRSVSGDWRDVAGKFEMAEVLALAREKPGFPLSVRMRDGRQTALVAAGAVRPDQPELAEPELDIDYPRLGREVAAALREEGLRVVTDTAAAVTAAAEVHTGAMVALRMSDEDAARLALDGGEPADQLHLTLMYLGKADELTEETRNNIISSMQQTADAFPPFQADAFAVDVFNPNSDERDTAIVLGISGGDIAAVHEDVRLRVPENLEAMLEDDAPVLPEQHSPFVAHVTLAYSDDLSLVEQLTDRTGQPVTFDRIRVAFGGDITDIPLAGAGEMPDGSDNEAASQAAELAAEVEAALDAVDNDARARQAAQLLAELEMEAA